uniref:Uncharacterized protein n=1 Tax=Salix viminalis TaxID=40686 RepID=A0A6N2KV42_SALVM
MTRTNREMVGVETGVALGGGQPK